ncbi:DUF5302 domain-containing protein [Actinokineospora auranticolor]|uniref:DUF5302 domain-containing protein n=1 Tax=Actinokineospora auranticolor TaxID=155976 RepID=A0A2S6GFK7_9PSEU|nr:DUF5302 domain-containing protein [Actinokineospora auranticolor]PPK64013.1 hypothetical protein CLV40_1224 [Actinokineospora auranticolor]
MSEQQSEQPETPEADQDDVKARFREALARKQAQASSREGHAQSGSKVHDAHGKAGGKRQFRRKSG